MTEPQSPPPAEISKMTLTLSLGATVTLTDSAGQATDWVKPSAETSVSWVGIPTPKQVAAARNYMQKQVLEPTLAEVLDAVTERTVKMRQGTI